jgi:hypothetical protein
LKKNPKAQAWIPSTSSHLAPDRGSNINDDSQASSFEVLSIKIQSEFGNSSMATGLLNKISTIQSTSINLSSNQHIWEDLAWNLESSHCSSTIHWDVV